MTISAAATYLRDLGRRIADLDGTSGLLPAADAIERSVRADGLIYIFGTGHSHMMAEEAHYRAGGLAMTVPILAGPIMLHEGAVASSSYERLSGIVGPIFDRYPIGPNDVLIVVSNSGVNAAPVEAAAIGRQRGATVIALTSDRYSATVAAGRTRIADVADIVLDNGVPAGDAVMNLGVDGLRCGPVSTSVGAALLNAVFAEVAARLAASGDTSALYLSANMPGAADHNRNLVARYRRRNPHL